MNYSDAERVSTVLDSFGFQKTEKETEADIICVIACSVRQHAVDRIFGKVKKWQGKPRLTTILSGCVLEKDQPKLVKAFDLIFEIKDINKLADFIKNKFKIEQKPENYEEYLSIIPTYDSEFRAFVPISTGCDNFCTYCAVPHTRGREKSRPMSDIINEIKNLIKNDYKEITLLGQNVNSYGQDISASSRAMRVDLKGIASRQKSGRLSQAPCNDNNHFIELIQKIDKIPGHYHVYFYSNHPKDMSDELIEALSKLKHFPHYVHLPLQSGSNQIIQAMNRHYTKKQYLALVKKIRQAMPDVTLTTDIIVGFPNETKKQFEDTVKVMKKVKFDMAYISQYSPRPGTVSAKIKDDISKEEKQNREKILQKTLADTALEQNQKLVGKTIKVLIDEAKKDKLYGRTEGYKVVEIKKSPTIRISDFVKVNIKSVTAWKLIGNIY
jgi:tRNA-2-methylthio-N6-dimethylallyladenosine synthase